MSSEPVEGELFIRNYMRPGRKLDDSIRARRRLSQIVLSYPREWRDEFVSKVKRALGIPYPYNGGYRHEEFFEECSVPDLLSVITILIQHAGPRSTALAECARIVAQEHLRYRLDPKGGVHYLVDEVFERNVQAAIEGLGAARFAGVLHTLNEALNGLSSSQPSGKALIRGVFEAVESCFLLVTATESNRINDASIKQSLAPILLRKYGGLAESEDRVSRLLAILSAWVYTAHPYRHGAAIEQIHEAPIDYAILLADQGLAHLRFIASL